MTTIRTMLAIAASLNWVLNQMNVKNTFLQRDLKEDLYICHLAGLLSTLTSIVCSKLPHSMYGLKQPLRAWYKKFTYTLLKFAFLESNYDTSVFLHKTEIRVVILLMYVNDIIITSTDLVLISQLKQYLHDSFHMKDLGTLTYFLGLEIATSSYDIFLPQYKHTQDLMVVVGLQDSNPLNTYSIGT